MSLTRGYFGLNAYTVYNVILILFGVIVVFQPFTVLMTAPYLIGTALIVTAVGEIYLGIKLKDTF